MKKLLFLFLIITLCLFSCKKSGDGTDTKKDIVLALESIEKIQYLKWAAWGYPNEEDIGKKAEEVKGKKLFEFGNKIEIVDELKNGDKTYYKIKLPDNSTYYVSANTLTEKFIIITATDIIAYSQPSEDYPITKYKLQPGDFAYYNKKQNGFINVEFISWLPRGKDNAPVWVGEVWIPEGIGYITDTKAARDGYTLALAYNKLYSKNPNKGEAIKILDNYDLTSETEITYVIRNLLNELGVTTKASNENIKNDNNDNVKNETVD